MKICLLCLRKPTRCVIDVYENMLVMLKKAYEMCSGIGSKICSKIRFEGSKIWSEIRLGGPKMRSDICSDRLKDTALASSLEMFLFF